MREAEAESEAKRTGSERERPEGKFPVTIAGGHHLYPYRTQKLSIITAKIVPRCDNSKLPVLFLFTDTSAYPFFILYPALI